MEISKQDWKLFREKLPDWQEAYMERLNQEYMEILSGENNPSDKFWTLYERICQDKRSRGVMLQLRKSDMLFDIVALVNDNVITFHDLEGFSDDFKEVVHNFCNREI